MKKILAIIVCVILALTLVSCASDDEIEVPVEPTQSPEDISAEKGNQPNSPQNNSNHEIGKIIEITDNSITIQLAEMNNVPNLAGPQNKNNNSPNEQPEGEAMNPPTNQDDKESRDNEENNHGEAQNNRNQSNDKDIDITEQITLSDETKSYTIVDNTEIDLSKIAIDNYVSITFDENENIISINVLG